VRNTLEGTHQYTLHYIHTFHEKTGLQLMMETEVTLTLQRKTVIVLHRKQFQGNTLGDMILYINTTTFIVHTCPEFS
jgi:hypothetical protein